MAIHTVSNPHFYSINKFMCTEYFSRNNRLSCKDYKTCTWQHLVDLQ